MLSIQASATRIDEIVEDVYRISTPSEVVPGGFTFNQFLIVDQEPLLFHTGLRRTFPAVKEAISRILPPHELRYIAFSHVEADECGALNDFLAIAPRAEPVCSRTAALVSVNDLADRPPRALRDGERLLLGRHTVRWIDTPHVPHGWESGLLFDERTRTLFAGDLFSHGGADVPPLTEEDILEASEADRKGMEYYSDPRGARAVLERLAGLKPRVLALMHGSSWKGDGSRLLRDLADRLDPERAAGGLGSL